MGERIFENPERAPEYNLHRHVKDANDTLPETSKANGMLMQDYRWANVQVVPSELADPAVSVLFWSEEAAQFVKPNPAMDFAAKGAGIPWETVIEANGRRMFVAVTAGMAADDEVKISVGGFKTSQV
jgi:hypothetical protein